MKGLREVENGTVENRSSFHEQQGGFHSATSTWNKDFYFKSPALHLCYTAGLGKRRNENSRVSQNWNLESQLSLNNLVVSPCWNNYMHLCHLYGESLGRILKWSPEHLLAWYILLLKLSDETNALCTYWSVMGKVCCALFLWERTVYTPKEC